jgi:glycosyltransferase involved in cell wall biosynthesis
MNNPVKILRLIARLNIGGPAIQAVNLSSELSGNHYQTLLVCGRLSSGEGDMTYLADEKKVEPLVIQEFGRDISLLDDLKSFFIIRKIIKHFQPDILHTHTAKAGTVGRLAALSLKTSLGSSKKVCLVHTFHGHTFHSYFSPMKTFFFILIEKILGLFTDKIIVVSEGQKKDICDIYKIADREKVRTIPLGFDLSKFGKIDTTVREARQKSNGGKRSEPLRIGVIGRLTAVKNHFMLLETMNCLRFTGKLDKFKFYIIGDGELKKAFIEKANKLNLLDAVVFKGWQKDMPSVYAKLDAIALTSRNEGTPVTLIEAMASCRPVVATSVGGVTDLLGCVKEKKSEGFMIAERGLMVQTGDAEAMAQALLYLSESPDAVQSMIQNAKAFVLAEYDQNRLLKDIKTLYGELLSK